ncbi:MAG: thiosulfate oxidation carrier protein SoxY [Betaproteobacteria bacterium RIFCSPLOWO2_02_FULL_64_12]|nr:MAG: thiosulfate oxidation carrier protein SoxY [Betaproteobacteria bacterium RIFCSPLOWO2_02_FULL_64_12]
MTRREILRAGSGLGLLAAALAAGWISPGRAWAQQWNKAVFDSKTVKDAIKALGAGNAAESRDVVFANPTPEIAENGAVVPITVRSNLPKTQSISLLIEKNPSTVAASFHLPEGTEPFVSTRVKMAETSHVLALVKADGKYYFARKEIKVTLGGCGG